MRRRSVVSRSCSTRLLASQLPLFASEPVVVVSEVEPLHSLSSRRVDVVQDAAIEPHTVVRVERVQVGLVGEICIVDFERERDEPVPGCLLFDGEFLDGRFVGNRAIVTNCDVTDCGEPECRVSITRVVEFETVTGIL